MKFDKENEIAAVLFLKKLKVLVLLGLEKFMKNLGHLLVS